jgi:hypothetical protein
MKSYRRLYSNTAGPQPVQVRLLTAVPCGIAEREIFARDRPQRKCWPKGTLLWGERLPTDARRERPCSARDRGDWHTATRQGGSSSGAAGLPRGVAPAASLQSPTAHLPSHHSPQGDRPRRLQELLLRSAVRSTAAKRRSVKGFTRNACCWLLEAPSSPWRTRVMEGAEDEDDAPARLLATLAALQARLHPPISPADPPVVGGGNLQRSEAGGQPDRTSLAPDEPVPEGGALEGEVANGWCAGASDECDQRAAAAEEEAGAAAAEAEAVQCELDELRRSLRARCSEAAQLRRQVRDPPALRPPPSPASLYGSSTQHGEGGGSAAGCADAADCHPCA